jgi:hypothetical protein
MDIFICSLWTSPVYYISENPFTFLAPDPKHLLASTMPVQEQSSFLIAELSPIIALDAIYVFFLLYRDRASNSWSIKASYVLFMVSAAGLLALAFALRAKPDGNVNLRPKIWDTNPFTNGLVIATIIL